MFKGWWEGKNKSKSPKCNFTTEVSGHQRPKNKSKSPKCNFTTDDGGIGTVDGAAWLGSASS